MGRGPDSGQGLALNKGISKSLVWLETKRQIQVYGSIDASSKRAQGLVVYGVLNHVKDWLCRQW